jgi:hypothetical protein
MNFQFTDIQTRNELSKLINFLHKQDLNYPKYDTWVQKTESELDSGHKKAILAFSEGKIVGNLVYQQHKINPEFLEFKNIRTHPKIRNRYFAKFMLRQAETENQNYDAIIVDAPIESVNMINFLKSCNYIPILSKPLYDNSLDVILIKPNKKSKKGKQRIIKSALEVF